MIDSQFYFKCTWYFSITKTLNVIAEIPVQFVCFAGAHCNELEIETECVTWVVNVEWVYVFQRWIEASSFLIGQGKPCFSLKANKKTTAI